MSSASQLLFGKLQGKIFIPDSPQEGLVTRTLYDDLTLLGADATTSLSSGITVTVNDPSSVLRITKPPGLTYKAWSEVTDVFRNTVQITTDSGVTTSYNTETYDTEQEAEDSFSTIEVTGSKHYTIWLRDPLPSDNTGGLSVKVENIYNPEIQPSDFSIINLFDYQNYGGWYDPSSIGTMYKDNSGTELVQNDGERVRIMLDKSGNGNHLFQDSFSNAPIYRTDGTYHWLEGNGSSFFLSTKILQNTILDKDNMSAASWQNTSSNSIGGVFEEVILGSFTIRITNYADTRTSEVAPSRLFNYAPEDNDLFLNNINRPQPNTSYVSLLERQGNNTRGRLNGVLQDSLVSSEVFNTASTRLIFLRQTAGDTYLNGKFYGSVIVSKTPSEDNITEIENYLSEKSGAVV